MTTKLEPLSRREFYVRTGNLREVEPLTQQAYEFGQWVASQKPNIGSAAQHHWHVSFHGSQFPGNDEHACGRRAIYTMMDIPRSLMPRWLEQVADAGKDIEDRLVMKWYEAGYLLSAPPFDWKGRKNYQTTFVDPTVWLSSTVDAIQLNPRASRGHVVEVKSKYAKDIESMLKLCRGPDPKHVYQLKAQIGLAHEKGEWTVRRCYNSGRLPVKVGTRSNKIVEICPEHGHEKCLRIEVLDPVDYGFIYYVSRDDPTDTWEFYYEYDPEFMAAGRRMLANWKSWFERGYLPQTSFSDKRFSHPFDWTWTRSQKDPNSPCEWCDFGDICREDHKKAVEAGEPIKLSDSHAISVARELRADYDLSLVQKAVQKRWGSDNGDAGV